MSEENKTAAFSQVDGDTAGENAISNDRREVEGAQGATVAGTHALGVSTPNAAAVAAATAGLAGLEHIPKVVHLLSIIVAAGIPPIITVCCEETGSTIGTVPNEQVQTAVLTTGFAIRFPSFRQKRSVTLFSSVCHSAYCTLF